MKNTAIILFLPALLVFSCRKESAPPEETETVNTINIEEELEKISGTYQGSTVYVNFWYEEISDSLGVYSHFEEHIDTTTYPDTIIVEANPIDSTFTVIGAGSFRRPFKWREDNHYSFYYDHMGGYIHEEDDIVFNAEERLLQTYFFESRIFGYQALSTWDKFFFQGEKKE